MTFLSVVTADASFLTEYNKRQVIIEKLSATYDEYRATYPQHVEARERLLNLFIELFNKEFDVSANSYTCKK